MPDSYVKTVKIVQGKIQLSVQVDEFVDKNGAIEYVEISGQATQTTGAFANFYDIQQVPAAPNVKADPNVPGDTDHYYIYVTGAPTPHGFSINHDVMVVMRAARVWLTVLEPSLKGVSDGAAWDIVKSNAQLAGGSW